MSGSRERWLAAFWHALPVTAVVLGLIVYWYAVANRTVVFLYDHDMGPRVPDTGPFSAVTRSRYWMAGLVAGGVVIAGYTVALFCAGRLRRAYRPPPWWRVWLLCALPLLAGIPAITMTVNAPTLLLADALAVTAATVAAVGLALTPGCLAATAPARLARLAAEGAGLAALASSVSFAPQAFALAQRGTRYGSLLIGAGVVAGLALVLLVEIARRRLRVGASPARAALIAGLCWAYLLLPLAHYLVGTDGWFYITTADNFFPASWWMLALGWLAAAAVATLVRHPGQSAR